jgi:hypothetical protein
LPYPLDQRDSMQIRQAVPLQIVGLALPPAVSMITCRGRQAVPLQIVGLALGSRKAHKPCHVL